MLLYHGSPNRIVIPTFGLGEERHDYGKGFYLTSDLHLAKEWAVCRPETESGYVHSFELDTDELDIFDFEKENILCWLAELMKHRDAADSKRYRILAAKFIAKYNERDSNARINMKALIDSDKNKVEKVFSTLV